MCAVELAVASPASETSDVLVLPSGVVVFATTDYSGTTYALAPLTGAVVWNTTLLSYSYTPTASADGAYLYVPSEYLNLQPDTVLYQLNASTGEHLHVFSPMVLTNFVNVGAEGKLLVATSPPDDYLAGSLVALDARNGSVLWQYREQLSQSDVISPFAVGESVGDARGWVSEYVSV